MKFECSAFNLPTCEASYEKKTRIFFKYIIFFTKYILILGIIF